jgi:hypothetical protein
MNTIFSTRGSLVTTLLFSVALAALGFQAASWWGVVAGAAVGAVVADRLMRRATVEAAASQAHAIVVTSPGERAATFQAAANTPDARVR